MGFSLNAISARDSHIWTLRFLLLSLFLLLLACLFFLYRAQRHITVHIPPDLTRGSVARLGDVPAPNVYAFALYAFQALNFWAEDGNKDYPDLIRRNHCFYTPRFGRWLKGNLREKRASGELNRARAIFPHDAYRPGAVERLDKNSWHVQLRMNLREWVRQRPVKDTKIDYFIRVVRFDANISCNPWGLALDAHVRPPQRWQE